MNRRKIRSLIDMLRAHYGLNTVPIDLDRFARAVGVEIKYADFEDEDLSGFAYQKGDQKFIGVNNSESTLRKRFTIGHELGHLFLHKENSVNYDQEIVLFRDTHASQGTDIKEVEANMFAAELLMPTELLRARVQSMGGITMDDEEAVQTLAKEFKVSRLAMTVRLANIYHI